MLSSTCLGRNCSVCPSTRRTRLQQLSMERSQKNRAKTMLVRSGGQPQDRTSIVFARFFCDRSIDSCCNRVRRVEGQTEQFRPRHVLDSICRRRGSVRLSNGVCTANECRCQIVAVSCAV